MSGETNPDALARLAVQINEAHAQEERCRREAGFSEAQQFEFLEAVAAEIERGGYSPGGLASEAFGTAIDNIAVGMEEEAP